MKKGIICIAGAILLAGTMILVAGPRTDFTGTWKLDRSRSEMPPPMGRGGPGGMGRARGDMADRGGMADGGARRGGGMPGGRGMGGMRGMEVTLMIQQTDSALTIIRTMGSGDQARTIEQHFSLGGTESTNPAPNGNGFITSKAGFQDNALVIQNSQTISTPDGDREMQSREELSLTDDSATLVISVTRVTPMGEQTFKEVYTRQ